VLKDPIDSSQISVNAGDSIYVMNDIYKSAIISSNIVSKTTASTELLLI
jgi:hypothetical protein